MSPEELHVGDEAIVTLRTGQAFRGKFYSIIYNDVCLKSGGVYLTFVVDGFANSLWSMNIRSIERCTIHPS